MPRRDFAAGNPIVTNLHPQDQFASRVPSPSVQPAWIGLGANQGDAPATFHAAVAIMAQWPLVTLEAVSPLYRSEPEGNPDQPWFTNAVVAITTTCPAVTLMAALLRLERRFGRRRFGIHRHAPRPLDLDLLLYADQVVRRPGLILPHPRLHLRRFVLTPLADLAADLKHPLLGKTVDTLRQEVNDTLRLERWSPSNRPGGGTDPPRQPSPRFPQGGYSK